jgi:YidC/Oxa1 family membrane protein insertase
MFQTLLVQPAYNLFILLIGFMPGGDVGLAIIALTLLIRVVFYPAFSASIRTQMGMQRVQGELDEINTTYKDNADEKAKRTMALFKEHKIRPFGALLALLIQLPVFLALSYTFFREGLPKIATNLLYSGVSVPAHINFEFLGVLNLLATHNILLALIVAALQWGVASLSLARMNTAPKTALNKNKDKEAALQMQQQMMRYALPVMMGVLAYLFPSAMGLYLSTMAVISLGQEWLIRRQLSSTSAQRA